MNSTERQELFDDFKNEDKEIKIIVNVNVLGEGIDIPNIDCICFMDARNSFF